MTGKIFSIEEFSVYDGPGIRSTVFMKGCPLRCMWCHNPEGQNQHTEFLRNPNGCVGCGNCIKTSYEENGIIRFTEESIRKCPMNLLRICGEEIDSEDLCRKLLKNEIILKNGGGITFSGGEPFSQHEFLFECISGLKGRLHTAIQTSGYCPLPVFQKSLEYADYFLFDLKLADDSLHKKYTGVSNKKILKNLSELGSSGVSFVIRMPLIPQVTDTEENIIGIAEILKQNRIEYIELLPYNKMAGGKYRMLMREYIVDFDENREPEIHWTIFEKYGIKVKIL